MTKGENFMKKENCKNGHCSSMSNSASFDLNSEGDILKLHDLCSTPKCKCQKRITFTPRQFQLKGSRFKNTKRTIFEETEKNVEKLH